MSGADGGSASLTYIDQTPVFVGGQPTQAQALPWLIPATAIQVSSVGGAGSVRGGTSLIAGAGGNGASVSISPAFDDQELVITLGNTAIPMTALSTAPVAGITATSLGAPGGVCCVVSNGVYSPVTPDSDPAQISPGLAGATNGSGGPVAVQFSGSITGSSANLYGIIGASVGASTQIPISYSPGSNNKAAASGTGGSVNVSLTDGQINLSGANSVGVFAASLSDQVIIPDGMVLLGTGNTAGAVDVSLDSQSSINLGSGSTTGQFSAAVVAISSTGWLFQPVGAAVAGAVTAGNGGNITVSNAGSISVSQNASAGIAALSLGNGGLLINAPASVTGVNYVSNSNAGAAGSNTGGSVTITNSGPLTVNGDSAIGVLAASNGTGGLVAGIPDATFGSSATNAQNIAIGSAPSGFVAGAGDSTFTAPGGSVSVTNSGTIQTTGGASAGNMAIGVLAQSVGGGGATYTEGVALHVGDAGGSGGNGGAISLTNSGAISTSGDGSIGFLGQSIGGGGGHGGNSKGLFVAVGGQGGSGGDGSSVTANLQPGSVFTTSGDFASGMILQSIGGGGGNGGYGKAHGIFFSTGIGGAGGAGGSGSAINVITTGSSAFTTTTSGDQSHGLLMQSIGGGGGTGGQAYSFSPGLIFAGAVSVGGAGGTAGTGGDLNLCPSGGTSCSGITGAITTGGVDSIGMFLQTIGGSGGNGGGAIAKAYALGISAGDLPPVTVSLSSAVGGSGANGADGGSINLASALNVSTLGTGAHAIFAQSVGGGGGAAADSTAGANSYNNTKLTFNAAVGIGGSGGGGGDGGTVQLTTLSNAQLSTLGHNATGLLAQSIGGGGGYGAVGNAYSNVVSTGGNQLGLSFGLGGNGGNGGAGGAVSISNAATISTVGSQSPGVLGQSIAGGGGLAGNGGAQNLGGNYNFSVAVGGNAGGGFAGGNVSVANSSNISTGIQLDLASSNTNSLALSEPITLGGDSHGIVAQSIGGGGGIGGNADPSASLIGSVQTLLNDGAGDYVNTTGLYTFFKSTSGAAPINYNGTIAIGGKGGSGGDGGTVSVTHEVGNITTYGHRAYGILAQSVGGGGGIGGSSTASSSFITGSASATLLTGFTLGLGINVGGTSGNGGDGGPVTVNLSDAGLTTTGYGSHAILAQSIGGGGGAGHDGSVFSASGSLGVSPSISVNPSVSLGSLSTGAGMQGTGGGVSVQSSDGPSTSDQFVTFGDGASVALMQSIGGGGGIASFGCTNSGNAPVPYVLSSYAPSVTASACLQNANSTTIPNLAGSLSPGGLTPSAFDGGQAAQGMVVNLLATGAQGTGSQGGEVSFTSTNQMLTIGNRSIAVVAQSIGGGGGYVSAPAKAIANAALPSAGTNNSAGGLITLQLSGPNGVFTAGSGAWGLLAQSIGGGGGFIGDSSIPITTIPTANSTGSFSSSGADGGGIAITVGQSGATEQPIISTLGAYSHGIVAQSVGGGGGILVAGTQPVLVGSSAGSTPTYRGSGGPIDIDLYGSVLVYDGQSVGVFAQSTGSTGNSGPISIDVEGSIYVTSGLGPVGVDTTQGFPNLFTYASQPNGDAPTGAAIVVSGGSTQSSAPNTITIGEGGFIGALNTNAETTVAILADYGVTNVSNSGTLNGSVDLGSTPGEFVNTGTFNAGSTVVVSNNSLHNYGLMRIGDLKTISETDLTGRFVQHEMGQLQITVDSLAPIKSDALSVQGKALIGGTIAPKTKSLLPGDVAFLAAEDLTISGDIQDSHLVDWKLKQVGHTLLMTPTADFTPDQTSFSRNHRALGNYLQRGWENSDRFMAPLFGLLHEASPSEAELYREALEQIGGAALNAQPIQMQTALATSLGDSLACPTVTPDGLKPLQRHCVWARATGDYTTQAAHGANPGYWVTAPGFRLGGQRDLGNGWSAGLAFGYGTNDLRSDQFSSKGDFFDVALSAKKELGPWELGGSLAFAQGWFENTRQVNLLAREIAPSFADEHLSTSSQSMLGLRLRAAYTIKEKNVHLKPYVDLDLMQSWRPAVEESGGDLALKSQASSDGSMAISPMLEVTLFSKEKGDAAFKAYASAGASFFAGNTISSPMSFRNEREENGTFVVTTSGPSVLGRLNLGAEASLSQQLSVRGEYSIQAGSGYQNQGLRADLTYRF